MLTVRGGAAIGDKGKDGATGHVGESLITGIHGAARTPNQMTLSKTRDKMLMRTLDDLLATVTVGIPTRCHALSVYPLTCNTNCETPAYLVLDEALATRQFSIIEVSESGAVPSLLAINESSSPIFLLDGEELVGAKQNRVLNLSIMLAPQSRTEIPVSCVEAGRWRTVGSAFETTDRVQFARGRAQKMEQVSRSLRLNGQATSDQTAVWDEISAKSVRMSVASPTGAMAALFESRQDDLRDYINAFPTSDDQFGAVYAIAGIFVGMEIFESPATFRKLAASWLQATH
jgi:hypothetical protein